ncbi:hypothetical protein KLF26_16410 (plasmid) [Clostridium perfringens]|uniref:hypothetical protein n=1 Tax=Clostridium perfringens TaxID=1502 RepID=UPI001CC964D3|nr:hypothetical protein [Clostridium perfringens]UBL00786.1 hypothetical protein KLF26_16410 [Clostridium perfringens]
MEVKEYTDKANNLFISINQSIAYIKHLIANDRIVTSQDTVLIEEDLEKVKLIIKELEQCNLVSKSQLEELKEKRETYYMIIDAMRRRNFKKTN